MILDVNLQPDETAPLTERLKNLDAFGKPLAEVIDLLWRDAVKAYRAKFHFKPTDRLPLPRFADHLVQKMPEAFSELRIAHALNASRWWAEIDANNLCATRLDFGQRENKHLPAAKRTAFAGLQDFLLGEALLPLFKAIQSGVVSLTSSEAGSGHTLVMRFKPGSQRRWRVTANGDVQFYNDGDKTITYEQPYLTQRTEVVAARVEKAAPTLQIPRGHNPELEAKAVAWTLEHAEQVLKTTGKKPKRDDMIGSCAQATGCTARQARSAWNGLSKKFKRDPRDIDRK